MNAIQKLYAEVEEARELLDSADECYGSGHDFTFECRDRLVTAEGALRLAVAYENETEACRGR